jgi:hypothetical protein
MKSILIPIREYGRLRAVYLSRLPQGSWVDRLLVVLHHIDFVNKHQSLLLYPRIQEVSLTP